MSKLMLINVGFNLSEPTHSLILRISQEIRDSFGSDWYLDDEKYHFHSPMYMIPIPQANKTLIKDAAEEYLEYCKRLDVEVEDMFYNLNGLLMLKFKLTPEILELHKRSLEYFNPLRKNLQRDKYLDDKYLSKLPEKKKLYVQKYGSEYILDHYVPHVTIARIKDEKKRKEILNKYRDLLIGARSEFDRLQVHTAIFSENKDKDRTILLFDKKIR